MKIIAAVLATCVALAAAWFFVGRTQDGPLPRSTPDVAETNGASASHSGGATGAAPSHHVRADTESTRDDRRALDSPATGLRFADLVRVVDASTGENLGDVFVRSWSGMGDSRAAAPADAVTARDLDEDGAWIFGAPGYAPSWLDGSSLDVLCTEGNEALRPVTLALVRTGTLRIDFDDERIRVQPATTIWVRRASSEQSRRPQTRDVGNQLRQLADDQPNREVACAALRDLRSAWTNAIGTTEEIRRQDVERALTSGELRYIAERVARQFSAIGAITSDLEVELPVGRYRTSITGGDTWALEHSLQPVDEFDLGSGLAVPGSFAISADRTFTIAPQHRALGRVVAEVPPGAREFEFRLERVASGANDGLVREFLAAREAHGRFEWGALRAGRYEIAASWADADGHATAAQFQFDLAEGEERDLGVPQSAGGAVLTLVPRFVDRSGLPIDPRDLDTALLRVSIAIERAPDDEVGLERLASPRRVDVTDGRSARVLGVAPGRYTLRADGVRAVSRPKDAGGDISTWEPPPRKEDLRLPADSNHTTIEVLGSMVHTFDVCIEHLLRVRIDIDTDPPLPAGSYAVHSWIVGDDGPRGEVSVMTLRHEGAARLGVPARIALPRGSWTVIVTTRRLGPWAPNTDDEYCGRCSLDVGVGPPTTAITLGPGAALKVSAADAARGLVLAELGLAFPSGLVEGADDALYFTGLLPDTEYLVGDRRVRTGPRYSVTTVE